MIWSVDGSVVKLQSVATFESKPLFSLKISIKLLIKFFIQFYGMYNHATV